MLTIVMVRLSSKRSLAEKTAFDAIFIVILASILSRAVNGTAGFFSTIGGGFVLVLLHRSFSWTPAVRMLLADSSKVAPRSSSKMETHSST